MFKMEMFTINRLIDLLENMGKDLGYEVEDDIDIDIENTATISFFGKEKKLLLSIVILYGGIYNKINVFDQEDKNIFSETIKENKYDINTYQNFINKVKEELNKNLNCVHVPEKIKEDSLCKVKKVWHSDMEQEINKMLNSGWELYSSMISEVRHDKEYDKVLEYILVFRRKEK
jgi:hypothetical protein